jgi:hypothetical protein
MKQFLLFSALLAVLLLPSPTEAHPIPDIPVRGYFNTDGTAIIRVEVDSRCFAEDAEQEPYLLNWLVKEMTPKEQAAVKKQAEDYVKKNIEFWFAPLRIDPKFEYTFTGFDNQKLIKNEDPVMITGEWKTKVPKGIEGYKIKALKSGKIDVQFLNHVDGKALERIHVLFPGEESFLLDLSKLTAMAPTAPTEGSVALESTAGDRWATLGTFMRQGFVHVVPLGLDHILFVLGLFFLSREWRPLLYQVSMFTLAHTITLGVATLGLVSVSGAIVEPIIALSIAYIAVENIYRPKYTHWRLVVVFIFGLIHGLGFAGALSELSLPATSLIIGLLGFNIGVEFGQLAVISIAFGATIWLKDAAQYRKYVVVPGSAMIAALGLYWTVERIVANNSAAEPANIEAAPQAAVLESRKTLSIG